MPKKKQEKKEEKKQEKKQEKKESKAAAPVQIQIAQNMIMIPR